MTESPTDTKRDPDALEAVLRRDKKVVKIVLVAVIVASWIFLLLGAGTGMLPHEMAVLVPDEMTTGGSQPEIEGMSDLEPLAPNDSAANKAMNRRVEINLFSG